MTGADTPKVPPQSQPLSLGGKKVSDLVSSDTRIEETGAVVGTLYYVSFPEFSNAPAEQSGNYFPLTLGSKYEGKTITIERKDGTSKTAEDIDWILRIPDKDATFTFKDGGETIIALNFAKATLDVPKGENAVSVPDQSRDFGAYGKTPDYISENVQIEWTGINGKVTGDFPYKENAPQFSDPETSSGHYYPLVLCDWYKEKEVEVNGKTGTDTDWIFCLNKIMKDSKKLTVKYAGEEIAVLDFSQANLLPNG